MLDIITYILLAIAAALAFITLSNYIKKENNMTCPRCGAEFSHFAMQQGQWLNQGGQWVHICSATAAPAEVPENSYPPQDPSTYEVQEIEPVAETPVENSSNNPIVEA